ncbi:MAG: hypothetical protein IJM30_08585 [Thermoguttaceae bacterium]|nr:hypothetical protein [Thermoguttaceae bacterium]
MAITTTCKRATARLFLLSLLAIAAGAPAALGQSANFRDASLMKEFAEADEGESEQVATPFEAPKKPYSATQIVSERPRSEGTKIRQVGATTRAAKPRPIRQTQYAPSGVKSAFAASSPQTLRDFDPEKPYDDSCPDPLDMPSIMDIPYKIVPTPGDFPENCPLPDEDFQRKAPTPITFTWKASNLCYKPLYFEDVQLERYGHYCHPLLQPVWSRVKFWLEIPVLPYMMGVNPPGECVYDLGYYRPGNCAPSMIEPIPISLRGGLLEAGAIVGVAAAMP